MPERPETESQTGRERSKAAGTGVSLIPPPGFSPSENGARWERSKDRAFIAVTRSDASLSEESRRYTAADSLKAQGITRISSETSRSQASPALLLYLATIVEDLEYREWLLLLGDERSTVQVRGAFPASRAERLGRAVEESLRTVEVAAP